MSPALQIGQVENEYGGQRNNRSADRVWIVKFPFTPNRGDLVAFRNPTSSSIDIKRCLGLPGERLEIKNNRLIIDGKEWHDPYGHFLEAGFNDMLDKPVEVEILTGHYFFLGDNRDSSLDSRIYGTIAAEKIVGRVWAIYWPPRRMTRFK